MKPNEPDQPLLDEIYLTIGFGKFHVVIIIIFGLTKFLDAAEMILLPLLGPILNCYWQLDSLETSFITMAVFTGMIFGSVIFGKLGDLYGRRKIILICVLGNFYFSLLSAASPSAEWINITRSMVGLFIGGIATMISTFLAEIMPINKRGWALMCVQSFWSLGSYYISLMTLLVVPRFGWRVLISVATVPMLVIIVLLKWLPESPRYLLLKNRNEEAIAVINRIAKMNKRKPVNNVRLIECKTSSIYDLCHPNYTVTTFISVYICLVSGLSYFGFGIALPLINNIPHKCLQNMSKTFNSSKFTNVSIDNSCCHLHSFESMQTMLIAISGELVSYIFAIFLINFIPRKVYLQSLLLVNSTVFILSNLCLSPHNYGYLMMFGRSASATMSGVNYLYVSEVFPTSIRSLSIGLGISSFRLGAILSSFIINILMMQTSFIGVTISYSVINFIAFLSVFLLPYETKDWALLQTVDEDISDSVIHIADTPQH